MNRHPAQEEADAVCAKYKEKTCSYGDDCQTEGCLYWHPYEEHEMGENVAEYTGEQQLSSGMGGLQLESGGNAVSPPTYEYEQWLLLNCPAPPTMDENQVYNMWHYPGSGMQRTPWEVYCSMYPQNNYNSESVVGMNGTTSQTWEPSSAAPSWEPASNNIGNLPQHQQQQQNKEPQTFQEWKMKGQPFPSWFCSDIDPWYDDDGVRRSLEEVYEVLYGPNAEENWAQRQYAQEIANDPTPAELAAMIDSKEDTPSLGTSPVVKDSVPARGGWASIAAKPPAPVVQKTATTTASANLNGVRSRSNSNAGSLKGEGTSSNDQKRNIIVIPKEVWLPSTANSDCFHLFPNPIERFKAVNAHHKSYLESVTIPVCFDTNNNKNNNNSGYSQNNNKFKNKDGKVALLDVHFQSAKTITPVLNRFLFAALKKNEEVWIVTGSGNHVAIGHQRREGGGVLFNAVKRYLEEHEEDHVLEFRVGKDTSGGKNKSSGGAFLVRRMGHQ